MVVQDVIIEIGSSNMAGFLANLYDVPVADYARWTSQSTPTALSTRPYSFEVPGVRLWTPRRPYSLNAQRALTVVGGGGGTTVTYGGSAIATPTATVDMWLFIREGSGIGNLRRIYGVAGQDLTVPVPFSPAAAVGDTLVVLQDSHTLQALSDDGLTITKVAGTTPNFTAADIGRFVSFFDSAAGGETTRKVVAQTNDTLTFDEALTSFPTTGVARTVTFDGGVPECVNLVAHGYSAGQAVTFEGGTPPVEVVPRTVYYVSATNITADTFELSTTLANALAGTSFTLTGNGTGTTTVKALGAITGANGFCVLSGANAVHTLATMQPPNAVLQPLTFTLDDVSPVYLTGVDYTNWDYTPFASPRALSFDPTINSVAELSFQVKSKVGLPLVVLELGVSASMISTFPLAVSATTTLVGPLHDITSLDFHPASPDGIYEILTTAITSMRTLIEAEGNTMKVRGIFINLFDNDGVDFQRIARLGSNTRLLRDSLRTFLEDERVPWIMAGPSAYGGGPGSATQDRIYEQLFSIAASDPLSGVVDTRLGYTYAEDDFHFSAFSQVRLGQDFFRVWEPIHDELTGPTAVADIRAVEIANAALMVVGESPSVTSLEPPEGSAHAPLCAARYTKAVKFVAESRHWTFIDRRAPLSKIRLASPIADVASNLIATGLPHGLMVGSPVSFELAADGTGTLPAPFVVSTCYYVASVVGTTQFSLTATAGGFGTVIDLTTAGTGGWRMFKESDRSGSAYMYALPADCMTERNLVPAGAPDDWPMSGVSAMLGVPYSGVGAVAGSVNGVNYSYDATTFGERKPLPCKRALNVAGEQVLYTNIANAELVYSRFLEEDDLRPPLFDEAVTHQLAADLAGAIKRDPRLARECREVAQWHISEAARVDAQRVVDDRPNRYPFSR